MSPASHDPSWDVPCTTFPIRWDVLIATGRQATSRLCFSHQREGIAAACHEIDRAGHPCRPVVPISPVAAATGGTAGLQHCGGPRSSGFRWWRQMSTVAPDGLIPFGLLTLAMLVLMATERPALRCHADARAVTAPAVRESWL